MPEDYKKFLKNLPMMPEVALKVAQISEEKLEVSFSTLESLIKTDPGLTAKVLKIANSALYSRQTEIKNLQAAIGMIGFRQIKSLVILVSAAQLTSKVKSVKFMEPFWNEALATAFLAREVMVRLGSRPKSEEAFLAGLLHNIGQIALQSASPEEYGRLWEASRGEDRELAERERRTFGTDHKELGGQVMKDWAFPGVYVDAALEHRSYNIQSSHKQIVLAVSLSDCLWEHHLQPSPELAEEAGRYALNLGLPAQDQQIFLTDYFKTLGRDPQFAASRQLFS